MQIRKSGCLLLFVGLCFFLYGQQREIPFKNTALLEVIRTLEQETQLVFNYNPELLETFSFTGTLNLEGAQFLQNLFYNTPLEYERSGNSVLIFLPDKKEFRLCGRILDQESRIPLALANIYTEDYTKGTQSNSEGVFEWSFSGYKNQKIIVSYVGYKTLILMLQDFDQVDCSDLLLELDPDIFKGEILITDYILDGIEEGTGYSAVDLQYQALSKNYSNIEQDLLKSVQLIPGITSIDESASNLQIRGGTADQNLVLWEGAALYDPGHLFGMISAINPFVVRNVKVFKGVFDANYDNRVGGIIDMSLSDSIPTRLQGGLGTTLTEAHLYLGAPIIKDQMSILVSGRNTINGIFHSPTLSSYSTKVFQSTKVTEEDENQTSAQRLNFYDLNAKWIFKPRDGLVFKAAFLKSSNTFNFDASLIGDDLESTDDVFNNSEALSLSTNFSMKKNWHTSISFSHSQYRNSYQFTLFEGAEQETIFDEQVFNDIKDQAFLISNQIKANKNWTYHFGYDYNIKTVFLNVSATSVFESDYDDDNLLEGHFHNPFVSVEYASKNFQANLGLRSTLYEETAGWTFSPRINLQYAVNPHLKFKLSGGILQQFVSQLKEFGGNDLGINNQVWIVSEADDNPFQEAKKIAGGLVFNKNGWLLDIEAYSNETDGLSTLSPLFGQEVNVPDFSEGSSLARGIDFLLKKRWDAYHIWLNYSLGEATYFFPEIEENAFPASNDQRHNLSLIQSFQHKNWNFSLSYLFRTGLPFSEPNGFQLMQDDEESYYEVQYKQLNRERLANYSRLDFGIHYETYLNQSNTKLEAAFSIINLLNQQNIFSRNYFLSDIDELDEEPELFFIDKFLLRRTPQLLLRVYW